MHLFHVLRTCVLDSEEILLTTRVSNNYLPDEVSPLAFQNSPLPETQLRHPMQEAIDAWLQKSPSLHTRTSYRRDLRQFQDFVGFEQEQAELMTAIRPKHVAAWRDSLKGRGCTNATIRRKMTVLRALFSYLQIYGYVGANPAHGKFVTAPAAPRDGKTVGLSLQACRQLLDAPSQNNPIDVRD